MDTLKFKRKIVAHGAARYVNLPTLWVRQQDLSAGELVVVEWDPATRTLLIRPVVSE